MKNKEFIRKAHMYRGFSIKISMISLLENTYTWTAWEVSEEAHIKINGSSVIGTPQEALKAAEVYLYNKFNHS